MTLPARIGSFRILRVLGQGGMGVVYDAVAEDGSRVALKTVLGGRGRLHLAVRREIHALARLHHPGIVSIVEEGEHNGVPWYAMAFVDGVTLRRFRSVLSAPTLLRAETEVGRSDASRPLQSDGSQSTVSPSRAALSASAPGPLSGTEALPRAGGDTQTGVALDADFLALVAGLAPPPDDEFAALLGERVTPDGDTLTSAGGVPLPGAMEPIPISLDSNMPQTGTGTGARPEDFAALFGAHSAAVSSEGTAAEQPKARMTADALGAPGEAAQKRAAASEEVGPRASTRIAPVAELEKLRRELLSATGSPSDPAAAVDHKTGRVVAVDEAGRQTSRRSRALTPDAFPRALELAERLCNVLAYLHGEGMIHRDLKPDNILVTQEAKPVLLDFGLVAHATGKIGRESFDEVQTLGAGTAPYIAPEQIIGELVDARSDLYALGCILYELIDGSPPFQGTVAQVFKQHLFDAPPSLREQHPWVPPALDELLSLLLAKRPSDRLGSAAVVARRLSEIGAREPLLREGPAPRPLLFRPRVAGRDEQLSALRDALREARAGNGTLAFIGGPSGFGKTRLALEIAREAATGGKLLVTGECVPQGGRPLQPLRRLLQNVAERCITSGSKETTRLGAGARVLAAYEPSLSGIPGVDELPEPAPLSGREARERVFATLWKTLCTLAEGEGLVLFIDDLQWADEMTLGFLRSVADRFSSGTRASILIVSTYRDDEAPRELADLAARAGLLNVHVGPLDHAAVSDVIAGCLGQPAPLTALTRFVSDNAMGNPFFVTEYTRAAVEIGAIEPLSTSKTAELWREAPASIAALPHNPRDLLLLRMRGVTGSLRKVADAVAILGTESDLATLRGATGLKSHEVFEAVDELRLKQIVEDTPGGRLRIVHDKLAEFIVDVIPERERKVRHGSAARAIEAARRDNLDEVADALAHHHAAAGNARPAVEHLLRAGDQARALYATRDAVRRYRRAVELLLELQEHDLAAKTLMKLGLVHTSAFEAEAARDAYEQAFALWAEYGNRGQDSVVLSPTHLSVAIGDPLSLDPARTYDTDSAFLQAQLFEGLVQLDVEFNVLPAVARRWSVSADGRRYRFELRDDARWSDGRPLNAIDFEMAWKRNLTPATEAPAAQLLYCVEGAEDVHSGRVRDVDTIAVRALSRLELDVTLRAPTAYFPYLLAHPITFPQPWWLIHSEGRRWTHPALFVGNGPYVLMERKERANIRVVKNGEYTGKFPGNAADIDFRIFHSYVDSYGAYKRGEIDVLDLISAPLDVIREARRTHARELQDFPLLSTTYVSFATDRAPFNDPRVRRAFAHAIDRRSLAARLEGGEHEVAFGGFTPPGVPGHQAEIAPRFDLVRARELLAEAGYTTKGSLPRLRWLHTHGVGDETAVDEIARGWRDGLGVQIEIEHVRYEQLEETLATNPPDIVLGAWIADYPDPDSFLRATFHSTEGHEHAAFHDARFDDLVSRAAVATQLGERLDLYAQADHLLVSEAAGVLPISYGRNLVLMRLEVAYFPRSSSYLRALKNVMVARGAT